MTEDTMEQSEDQDSANDTNSNNPSNDTIISTSGKVTIPGDITSIGQDITESLNSVLQLLIHKKRDLTVSKENTEKKLDEEIHESLSSNDENRSQEIIKGFERKRNELYQNYLRELGSISESALNDLMNRLDPLPHASKLFAMTIHEFGETIKEIDRTRRKFAVDLKRRMDERRQIGLENRLEQAMVEISKEKERAKDMAKEIDDLTRSLTMNQAELRKRISSDEEWKTRYSADLRETLTEEIRSDLEQTIRRDVEKRIRSEVMEEIKSRNGNNTASRVKQVKQPGNGKNANSTMPFVRCPSCREKIIIRSTERPIEVTCPGCHNEYTIKDKDNDKESGNAPDNGNDPLRDDLQDTPDNALSTSESVSNAQDHAVLPDNRTHSSVDPPSSGFSTPDSGTRQITCPFCSKVHIVPVGLTKRLTCACGRRIRTT